MTDLLELEDREIDALVAVKCMGWRKEDDKYYPSDARPKDWPHGISVPYYSKLIDTAWEVVEKLESMGLCVYITNSESVASIHWSVFVFNHHRVQIVYASGPTAELAICRAALLAIEKMEQFL